LGKEAAEIESDIKSPIPDEYKSLYQHVRKPYAVWREEIKVRAAPEYRGEKAWRIRVWLESSEGALRHVSWVDYESHPEYEAVQRRSIRTKQDKQQFRHWLNAWDDFWIRIRCSDGVEIADWLSNAISNTDLDVNGNPGDPDQLNQRNQCVDDLRKAVIRTKRDEYHKHPWCEYADRPPRS
jgi:hypothetical protein